MVERIDENSVSLRNMHISHVLTHHASILRLHEAVVVGMPRPLLSLSNEKLVQEFCDNRIDELASVVGMKAKDHERKLGKQVFQEWRKVVLRDFIHAPDDFPLRHFVHDVDVVDPLFFA
jgi:hypothetical protein